MYIHIRIVMLQKGLFSYMGKDKRSFKKIEKSIEWLGRKTK
jgi:hypothetical protein